MQTQTQVTQEEVLERQRRSLELTEQVRATIGQRVSDMAKRANVTSVSLVVVENPTFGLASACRLSETDPVDIVLSSDALTLFTESELLAVIGHELGHIASGDLQSSSMPTREKELTADRIGVELTGDLLAFASALRKIEEYNKTLAPRQLDMLLPSFLSKRGTWKRAVTEGVLRSLAAGMDRILGTGYPTVEERIKQLTTLRSAEKNGIESSVVSNGRSSPEPAKWEQRIRSHSIDNEKER